MSARPARVAFVGDETIFGPALPSAGDPALPGLTPATVDLRPGMPAGDVRGALAAARPDVVVLLGPPFPPDDALTGLEAVVLAHATEPAEVPARTDRTVGAVPFESAWRTTPVPVADRHFAEVVRAAAPPRIVFLGRSTEHREQVLSKVKHDFDVLHVADGVWGDDLLALLGRTDVGLNAHRAPASPQTPAFEHRVALHLAAGHLLVSEPLQPSHGLEAGIDFVQVADGEDLHRVVGALRREPQLGHRIRIRGRLKAERFRASRVWPRVVADARLDVAAFGRARRMS